jgi:hypothetical protein
MGNPKKFSILRKSIFQKSAKMTFFSLKFGHVFFKSIKNLDFVLSKFLKKCFSRKKALKTSELQKSYREMKMSY